MAEKAKAKAKTAKPKRVDELATAILQKTGTAKKSRRMRRIVEISRNDLGETQAVLVSLWEQQEYFEAATALIERLAEEYPEPFAKSKLDKVRKPDGFMKAVEEQDQPGYWQKRFAGAVQEHAEKLGGLVHNISQVVAKIPDMHANIPMAITLHTLRSLLRALMLDLEYQIAMSERLIQPSRTTPMDGLREHL